MRIPKFLIAATMMLFAFGNMLYAQTLPFTIGTPVDVGARAAGLGGAMTGVGGTYSSLYYNPAGLGLIEKPLVTAGFSQLKWTDTATSYGNETMDESTYTKLDAMGIALPVPTQRGSLVFSFGYHKQRSYDSRLKSSGMFDVEYEAYDQVFLLDGLNGEYDEMQNGHLSQTSFGVSVEMARNIFFGAALNFWNGHREYTWNLYEEGGVWIFPPIPEDPNEYQFMIPDFERIDHFEERYGGTNVTLGTLVKSNPYFHFGAVIETPLTLTAKRDWDFLEREWVYEGWEDEQLPDTSDAGFYDYKMKAPWKFRIGGALYIGPMMISGDAELVDYSQMLFQNDPPSVSEGTKAEINQDIRDNFRSVWNPRLGMELTIPRVDARLRGGYAIYKSPWKNSGNGDVRKILSFGGGVTLSKQIMLDIAYQTASWDGMTGELIETEEIKMDRILFSMTYNMR